jgi:hypothetical protein
LRPAGYYSVPAMGARRKKSDRSTLSKAAREKRDETVRSWLGHYGAPLLVAAHLGPADVPPLEHALVHGLGLAHRDALVAEVLPLLLWHQREQVDFAKLALLARKQGEAQALGLFLELTGELAHDRPFGRVAKTLRDRRYRRMTYFFPDDGRTDLSREVTHLHTPRVAKRWHFFMNMTFEGFASNFRKFIRADAWTGRNGYERGRLASRCAGSTMELDRHRYLTVCSATTTADRTAREQDHDA